MKRGEYVLALHEALAKAGLPNSLVIPGEQMSAVAMHLPTAVLRAVIKKEVVYDEDEKHYSGAVAFHQGWTAACDDELTDRILTENLYEGKE